MTDLEKVIISLSSENFKDADGSEEEIASLAYGVAQDAMLENPLSPEGKDIRFKALAVMADHEKGIESPYIPKSKFNYTGMYIKSANDSIPSIFDVLARYFVKHPECFGRLQKSETEAESKVRESIEGEMAEEVFKILDSNDMKVFYYSFMFEDIKNMILTLDKKLSDRLGKLRGEIIDITVGAKNPDPANNELESRFATHEQLENAHKTIVGDKKKALKNTDASPE